MYTRPRRGIIRCVKVGIFEIQFGESRGLRFRVKKELNLADGDRVIVFGDNRRPFASFWGRGTTTTKGTTEIQIEGEGT